MRLRRAARPMAALIMLTALCRPAPAANSLRVMVSTTLLQSAVTEIGGRHASATALMAPGSCPGHYDVCPRDIRTLSSSKLVLTHGHESFIENMVRSMGGRKPRLIRITTSGNWMVPEVYFRGVEQVADALCKADPEHSADYRATLPSVKAGIRKLAAQLLRESRVAGAPRVAVLCSNQQAEFVKWMGFKVVGTYARAEEFTPAKLHRLTVDARRRPVRLVIDNLQSGPTAGSELASDIGARHVTLSSFPGGFAGTDNWSKCLRDNANRLIREIARR
jgi:zinc transport system substrate-binding protein